MVFDLVWVGFCGLVVIVGILLLIVLNVLLGLIVAFLLVDCWMGSV